MNEKLQEILTKEGAVAIVAQGEEFPHVVNTWHSYIEIDNEDIIIPVAGMKTMEECIAKNPSVILTLGSKEVVGIYGPGAGFLINGGAKYEYEGKMFELMSSRFEWVRAIMRVTINKLTQTV